MKFHTLYKRTMCMYKNIKKEERRKNIPRIRDITINSRVHSRITVDRDRNRAFPIFPNFRAANFSEAHALHRRFVRRVNWRLCNRLVGLYILPPRHRKPHSSPLWYGEVDGSYKPRIDRPDNLFPRFDARTRMNRVLQVTSSENVSA